MQIKLAPVPPRPQPYPQGGSWISSYILLSDQIRIGFRPRPGFPPHSKRCKLARLLCLYVRPWLRPRLGGVRTLCLRRIAPRPTQFLHQICSAEISLPICTHQLRFVFCPVLCTLALHFRHHQYCTECSPGLAAGRAVGNDQVVQSMGHCVRICNCDSYIVCCVGIVTSGSWGIQIRE